MKLTSIALIASSLTLTQCATGVDCSTSAAVCDRDSECCGTGKAFTVAENTS